MPTTVIEAEPPVKVRVTFSYFGRGNWMFCGSDNGGNTAAILFSFIATCQRHHLNPFEYLRDVLGRIASTPISKLAELLPGRWTALKAEASPASNHPTTNG